METVIATDVANPVNTQRFFGSGINGNKQTKKEIASSLKSQRFFGSGINGNSTDHRHFPHKHDPQRFFGSGINGNAARLMPGWNRQISTLLRKWN